MNFLSWKYKLSNVRVPFWAMAITAALLTTPASAMVVQRDLSVLNDGLITYDSDTNLEWLDVTETLGQSYNGVVAGFGGFVAMGFGVANTDQLGQLLINAGFANITGGNLLTNHAAAEVLVELLGVTGTTTSGNLTAFKTSGFTDFVPLSSLVSLSLLSYSENSTGWGQAVGGSNDKDFTQADFGVFLVREGNISTVPIPAALPLFGTGIALLGFLGWRRKRKSA